MASYSWKEDGPKPKVSAQIFGEFIERIAGDISSAKPEDIVRAALNTPAVRDIFEWNNTKAGDLYRREQARNFIGRLQIVRVDVSEGQQTSNRAFFSVNIGKRAGYVPVDRILDNGDLKRQVLEDACNELERFIRKFAGIIALGTVVPRLEDIITEMKETVETVTLKALHRPAKTITDRSNDGLQPGA